LQGITVAAYNADGTIRSLTLTDGDGAYQIVAPAGDYPLAAFDNALTYLPQTYPSPAHVIADQTLTAFDFALSAGARVSGRVSSQTIGRPLSSVTIGAYDLNGQLIASTLTNGSGDFVMLLAPATLKLLAFDNALQFATAYYGGAQSFAGSTPLGLTAGQSLTADFALPDAGRIGGTVADMVTVRPLSGMQVIVYDTAYRVIAETTSDATGTFKVALPAGSYLVAAADLTHRYDSAIFRGGFVSLAAGQDAGPLQILLSLATPHDRRRAVKSGR